MSLLTDHELNMYRTRFLCSLDMLAKDLIDNPVSSDEIYGLDGISGFPDGLEATDSLVQDAVTYEYVKLGTGREIMLTIKGLQWCKEICE
ncbi:MAG: hypothetical protein ACRD8W_18400 [Nitrososphaeraceae archaeon]